MSAETVKLYINIDSIADGYIIFYIKKKIVSVDKVLGRSDIYIAELDKLSKYSILCMACTRRVNIVYQRVCTDIYPAVNTAGGTG